MVEYVENWASVAGFIVRGHPKGYFVEKDWPFEYPFVMQTIFRGLFYCSPKSPGRIKRSKCDWRVPYRFDKEVKHYEFIGDKCNLIHGHNLPPKPLTFDGRMEVKLLHQLTTDEAAFIKLHALTRVTVPNIQIHLEGQFPNRSFEYELIRRVRDHALDEKYGPDRVQMHDLFRKGDEIQKHGGLFVVDPSNEDFGMEAIHYQTSLFRRYALTYGVNQLKFVDGTHHLNLHKPTTIIWSGVDRLLRTKFMGVTYAFSEHSKPIIRGARLFPG